MTDKITIEVVVENTFDPQREDGNTISYGSEFVASVTYNELVFHLYKPMLGGLEIKDVQSRKTWSLGIETIIHAFLDQLLQREHTEIDPDIPSPTL